MPRIRVCDAAVAVLRETDNPAVMHGDCGLLDMIFMRAGLRENPRWRSAEQRHQRVLNALSRQPGILVPGKSFRPHGPGFCRVFRLPEDGVHPCDD